MKKKILSLIFSAMLATGLTTSSNANIFEGLGVGFSVGTAGFYAEGEEKTDNQKVGEDMAKDGGAFQHDLGSIFIEYTAGPITAGVDWNIEEINTPEATNVQFTSDASQVNLTNKVKATFENHVTAYIMLPIWGGLYTKVGGMYVDIVTNESLGTGGNYGNTDTTGWTAGLGFQHEVQDGFSIRGEVMGSRYEDVSVTNSANTSTSVHITEMMGASAKFSVVKTF
tara:strand:- start:33 stop:707 length:675 start_codon:yes stop_codon:yes gene_type:complete